MGIVLFGSINKDLVARTLRLPFPGEPIIGNSFKHIPEEKGLIRQLNVHDEGLKLIC